MLEKVLEIAGLVVAVLAWLFPPESLKRIFRLPSDGKGAADLHPPVESQSVDHGTDVKPAPKAPVDSIPEKIGGFTVLDAGSDSVTKITKYVFSGVIGTSVLLGLIGIIFQIAALKSLALFMYFAGLALSFLSGASTSYALWIGEDVLVIKTPFDQNGRRLPWAKITKIAKGNPSGLLFTGTDFKVQCIAYMYVRRADLLVDAIQNKLKPEVYSDAVPLMEDIKVNALIKARTQVQGIGS